MDRDEPSPAAATGSPDPPAADDVYCPGCAYNLRGVTSDRCPECGRQFDRATIARQARLPWSQRKRLGRFKAYWRTALALTLRSRHLIRAADAGTLDFADARKFWLTTVAHAWLPIAGGLWAAIAYRPTQVGAITTVAPSVLAALVAAVWPAVIVALCLFLWLAAATGVGGYFCHPRRQPVERQNRAVIASYYAAAPLAPWGVLLTLLEGVGWFTAERLRSPNFAAGVGVAGVGVTLLAAVDCWAATLRVLRHVAGRGRPFTALAGAALPLIWALLFVLIALLLPAMLIYAGLFLVSLSTGG